MKRIPNLNFITEGLSFSTFYHLIDQSAKGHPNSVAIKFNDVEWTYQEVAGFSNKLSRLLINSGVKKGDIIGLAVDRSPEMIISLLGILKAGAAYIPLDPTYPKDRIEFMLRDSKANMLLTSKKYQNHFTSGAIELLLEDIWEQLHELSPENSKVNIDGDDLAYVLYTSGSTGQPKGVMVSHKNLDFFLTSMRRLPGIKRHDRLLAISTISFDIAAFELFLPLTAGAQIILADADTAKDGWLLLELMQKEYITIMQATPYTWRMLIAAGWEKFLPVKIITGGEPLPKDLAAKLLKRCKEVWNQYGPTETTVYSTQKLIKSADEITIGKPVGETKIYILNESLNKCPAQTIGEIFIGGDGVAKGYFGRPELTAERFIDDPFTIEKNTRMYRTGDMGRFTPSGEIQCLGRIDKQVKIRGFRIEPEEIEYALQQANSVVQAVIAVLSGVSGIPRLVAYVVCEPRGGSQPEKAELRKSLSNMLPAYMIPDDFVFLAELPVTPNGKIDRKALPPPTTIDQAGKKEIAAPKTEMEERLKTTWENAMGLSNLSVADNFFALGGHSLVAVQIMSEIDKITGNRLPIDTLLKYPTIAELAFYLEGDKIENPLSSLVPIKPEGCKPPLYIIHGEGLNVMYFNDLAANMDKDQPVFGLQARGLKGEEPLEVMEDIAAGYINEILSQNTGGPFVLAGYSFGGYVAVEMRKQLKAMGKEVRLIIFDTDAEKSEYKNWMYLWPRKVKRHLPRIALMVKNKIAALGNDFRQEPHTETGKFENSKNSKDFYRQIKKIKDKLRTALRNYSIEPFDDKVYLYKPKICTHYVDDVMSLGWKKYAKKGVEICEVSGDHLSMLKRPHVQSFAARLQQGIDGWAISESLHLEVGNLEQAC